MDERSAEVGQKRPMQKDMAEIDHLLAAQQDLPQAQQAPQAKEDSSKYDRIVTELDAMVKKLDKEVNMRDNEVKRLKLKQKQLKEEKVKKLDEEVDMWGNEIERLKLQQQRLERGEFDKIDLQAILKEQGMCTTGSKCANLRVSDIKEILKERGMCTTGSKAELVARLEANNEVLEASRQRELLAQTVAQRGSKAELQEET